VSVSSKRGLALIALLVVSVAALAMPGVAMAASKKPAPSVTVLGFGINWLFVAKGATVKSEKMCDEIVASDTPVGPPQQVYVTVFVEATGVPKKAPTQIKDTAPFDDASSPTFTEAVPFSQIFGVGAFAVGSPPGDAKNLFYEPIVSFDASAGPAADEFNGEYTYSVMTKVAGHTLKSSATIKVACPVRR
jgi:hypothetical protein